MCLGQFLLLAYLLGTTVLYNKYWLNGEDFGEVNFIKSLYANFITLSTAGKFVHLKGSAKKLISDHIYQNIDLIFLILIVVVL